jgi:hypothetical protein
VTQIEVSTAEANMRLLLDLQSEFQAEGLGAIYNFFAVDRDWRCPACYRNKREIARIDKNGNLLCALVWHHDHFCDCFDTHVGPEVKAEWAARSAMLASFVRFPNTLICNDCNVCEPYAKNIVGAPAEFSFAPYEIAGFIDVGNNRPHTVNSDNAKKAYEAALPMMRVLAQRLRAVNKSVRVGDFEPVAQPAFRVLHQIRKAREAQG